jgi:hypothetical protein
MSLQNGEVPESDVEILEKLLMHYWNRFSGSESEGMEGYKLVGRMEDVYCKYPILTFDIERHGDTVLGSKKTEIHTWFVDIEIKQANCQKSGRYKLIEARNYSLDVVLIAEELTKLILNHQEDPRLKWKKDGTVHIKIGDIISIHCHANLNGRRYYFKKKVDEILLPLGWQKLSCNHYAPPTAKIISKFKRIKCITP